MTEYVDAASESRAKDRMLKMKQESEQKKMKNERQTQDNRGQTILHINNSPPDLTARTSKYI